MPGMPSNMPFQAQFFVHKLISSMSKLSNQIQPKNNIDLMRGILVSFFILYQMLTFNTFIFFFGINIKKADSKSVKSNTS